VDDVLDLEVAGGGHHRGAYRRAADAVALLLDGGAALLGDGARHPGAELELLVGGVDDDVHRQVGDVPLQKLQVGLPHLDGEAAAGGRSQFLTLDGAVSHGPASISKGSPRPGGRPLGSAGRRPSPRWLPV